MRRRWDKEIAWDKTKWDKNNDWWKRQSDIEEIEPDRMIEEWGKRARHVIIEERKKRLNNWGKKKKQNDWGKGR